MKQQPVSDKIAYSIDEARAALGGWSRDRVYAAIRERKIAARKLGKRTIILRDDLIAFARDLPAMNPTEPISEKEDAAA